MQKYGTIDKLPGETPLEALGRFKVLYDIPEGTPLAYAGRLDPMASGKLLVLIGDECKRQSHYHGLDKAYDFEFLLGFRSDTGDLLGLAERSTNIPKPATDDISRSLHSLVGSISLPYPHYSSKTVREPLFLWTLENRLHEIEIPTAHTTIYTLSYKESCSLSATELLSHIETRIAQITPVTAESKALGADFRRIPILARWSELLAHDAGTYTILKMRTVCSSGTYIRSLAPHIASHLSTYGLAYSIHRTHVGRFHPLPLTETGFWYPKY